MGRFYARLVLGFSVFGSCLEPPRACLCHPCHEGLQLLQTRTGLAAGDVDESCQW